MYNTIVELDRDSIAARRFMMLADINRSYINFHWEIGKFFIDKMKQYDDKFIEEQSEKLTKTWGNIFSVDNIQSAIAFAMQLPDIIHVGILGGVITWKYLKALLPLNDTELLLSFTKLCIDENLSIEVLQESVDRIIKEGNIPVLPKVKRKETKIDYLYTTETVEHEKKGEASVKSHEILIFGGEGQQSEDGIINNLFPDTDLELFLKMGMNSGTILKG